MYSFNFSVRNRQFIVQNETPYFISYYLNGTDDDIGCDVRMNACISTEKVLLLSIRRSALSRT